MADKRYYWLRLKKDFFKSKEMKKLRKIAGGDTYTIIYLKMQLASINSNGVLYYEGVEDSFSDELALDIDEDAENVRVTVLFLLKYGLLVESSESEFSMPEVIDCIGSESQSASRVRDHRNKMKALQCNATVTKCNTEREKEKDIEKKKEKKEPAKGQTPDKCPDRNPNKTEISSSSSLPPAIDEIKRAFEKEFHPIFKATELDALSAYIDDYGRMGVLKAIETASKRKSLNKATLSPRYLLPILQQLTQEKSEAPANAQPPVFADLSTDQQKARILAADKARMKKIQEADEYGVYGGLTQ